MSERTWLVMFKITADDERADFFGDPTPDWIEQQVAQPNASIFKMVDCTVEEVEE